MKDNRKKKQRGQSRKLKAMFRYIDDFQPFVHTDKKFEHFHVPSGTWIDSPRTSGNIKTEFCRKWLAKTEEFILQKPKDIPFCKVVAEICVPYFWNSQIMIFYDADYYNSFWDRTGPYQFWTPMESAHSFCRERGISTSLREKGYHEKLIEDADTVFEDDVWLYGEFK